MLYYNLWWSDLACRPLNMNDAIDLEVNNDCKTDLEIILTLYFNFVDVKLLCEYTVKYVTTQVQSFNVAHSDC